MGKLFGTDGIRGIANEKLSPELAYKTGIALAKILEEDDEKLVLIGRDTRRSGNMLESALISGLTSMGIDVMELGVIPTPALPILIEKYNGGAGIMISASHNPGEYNGIKIFNKHGYKLSDKKELEIEKLIKSDIDEINKPIGKDIGLLIRNEQGALEYEDYLIEKIGIDLKGITVAMDCGNGALYEIGPRTINRLGGKVISINTEPDGMNINDNCGSTNPELISELVKDTKADIGISFDGDGDRIIAADEKGNIIDGDHILAICGKYLYSKGKLNNNTVVGTIMTNMGLDDYFNEMGIKTIKTQVGDRYILQEMLKNDYSLGGEQSGHIIIKEYNKTGDGLATGLLLLKVAKDFNEKLSTLNEEMINYPQVLINAKVDEKLKYKYLENKEIKEEIEKVERNFSGKGRVVIRPSGTEPLVRVMIEAKVDKDIEKIANDLARFIEERLN